MKWNIDKMIANMERILSADRMSTTFHRVLRSPEELERLGIKSTSPMELWVFCIGPETNRIYGNGRDVHEACLRAWKQVKRQYRLGNRRKFQEKVRSRKKVVDEG